MAAWTTVAWTTAAAWAVVVLLWAIEVAAGTAGLATSDPTAARAVPPGLSRAALLLAACASLAVGVLASLRIWHRARALDRRRRGRTGARRTLLGLAALLLLAAATHYAGLGYELTGRTFGDEGIYLAGAQRINSGQYFSPRFIYPHLLFQLDALTLWGSGLFPAVTAGLAGLWGAGEELARNALVTRWLTAALGLLGVLAAFLLGRRIAGPRAGLLAGLLTAVSPLWLELAQLNLSDLPAATFATLCMAQAAAGLRHEGRGQRRRGPCLAGVWAGLAAGSKYPAGLVAIALVPVFLRRDGQGRRRPWRLLAAAAAAIGAFLLATPSLLALPEAVFRGGGADILFGARQYATGGWAGVTRASNLAYYGGELVRAFGLPALLAGVAGLAGLSRVRARRLVRLAAFPLAYLLLILAMAISVRRNLLPVLPTLAAFVGVGLDGLWRLPWLSARRRARAANGRSWRPALAAGVLIAALLAPPAVTSVENLLRWSHPSTRELAAAWIAQNLPPGSFIVQESYTPVLPGFQSRQPRFAFRVPAAELEQPQHDFLLLSSQAYERFLNPQQEHIAEQAAERAERYRQMLESYPSVYEIRPDRWRGGPTLRLLRIEPAAPAHRPGRRFSAAESWPLDAAMRQRDGAVLVYRAAGQWALFKEYLRFGRYRVTLDGPLAGAGTLEVRTLANEVVARVPVDAAGTGELSLPRRGKYLLYLFLPPGSRLRGWRLERQPAG